MLGLLHQLESSNSGSNQTLQLFCNRDCAVLYVLSMMRWTGSRIHGQNLSTSHEFLEKINLRNETIHLILTHFWLKNKNRKCFYSMHRIIPNPNEFCLFSLCNWLSLWAKNVYCDFYRNEHAILFLYLSNNGALHFHLDSIFECISTKKKIKFNKVKIPCIILIRWD